MAEDGSPKIYSPSPRESRKTPTEAAIFFGADNTIPRTETTITSEGDHVTPVTDFTLEGDFSTAANKLTPTKEKLKLEDDVESRIKTAAPPEKEVPAPTDTTDPGAKDAVPDSFIAGENAPPPAGAASLIDFSSAAQKEDVVLASAGPGHQAEAPGPDAEAAPPDDSDAADEESPALAAEEGDDDGVGDDDDGVGDDDDGVEDDTSPAEPAAPEEEAEPVAEAELCPAAEKHETLSADEPEPEAEPEAEAAPAAAQERADAGAKPGEAEDDKFITVFELTAAAEKSKENSEDALTDEEGADGVHAWIEKDAAHVAETNSVLLTAVESRYDFVVPASAAVVEEAAADTAAEEAPDGIAAAAAAAEVPEAPPAAASLADAPSPTEDPATPETGLFKLLKEDPDELMM